MLKQIFKGIKIVFQDPLSHKVAAISSFAIGYLFYWLLYKVTTIPTMFQMAKEGEFGQYSYAYFAAYWSTTLVTIILFGISAAILVWLWRKSLLSRTAAGSGGLGAFIGALGAACPVCGAFLLSLLGVSAGVSIFPLQGLELKFLSLGLVTASTAFAATRVTTAIDCGECADISKVHSRANPTSSIILPLEKIFIFGLAALFLINQLLISQVMASLGMTPRGNLVASLFNIRTASVMTVIAPKLNPDGKTTTLAEFPTITEVSANPNSSDPVADAKVVMVPTGKPFYAPDDISFDDPINAQNKWGAFEDSITLSKELQTRYDQLINTFTCNYCCGGPNQVTVVARCGCKHAKAWRGMFKYMLQTYGDKYTNEQLMGEAYRWTGIWYPKGVLEDYLLATGKGDVLGHQTHGGAGSDGRHGL